jgi:CRISPR-associated endonuclease Csn1
MTAMLRGKFGLNTILSSNVEKNREDHRHHAVDACVVAVTDQGLLQRFSRASASAREQQLSRLVSDMPLPWASYRESVQRAIQAIKVSHRPDHNYQGAMHNDTAYGLLPDGEVSVTKLDENGHKVREVSKLAVIPFTSTKDPKRQGSTADGNPRPYKGYKGDSNYCIEIVKSERGKWEGEVISTFQAYQIIRQLGPQLGFSKLRSPTISLSGRSLVMRLQIGDTVRLEADDSEKLMRVATIKTSGNVIFAPHNEANVDARNRDNEDPFSYLSKTAGSLQKVKARRVTVSPCGELRDPGFPG